MSTKVHTQKTWFAYLWKSKKCVARNALRFEWLLYTLLNTLHRQESSDARDKTHFLAWQRQTSMLSWTTISQRMMDTNQQLKPFFVRQVSAFWLPLNLRTNTHVSWCTWDKSIDDKTKSLLATMWSSELEIGSDMIWPFIFSVNYWSGIERADIISAFLADFVEIYE